MSLTADTTVMRSNLFNGRPYLKSLEKLLHIKTFCMIDKAKHCLSQMSKPQVKERDTCDFNCACFPAPKAPR